MDIRSISDLLNKFVEAESQILNNEDIKHPVTIGAMYEGLTEEVLNKSIFDGLDLRVIKNSFIKGCDTEFDVMLVTGDGENIPHTERYKYEPEQVIAIIQVKKNLFTKDVEEGYENLKYVINHINQENLRPFMARLFRDAFRLICRKDTTAYKTNNLNEYEESIYHTLKIEAALPVRMIWGYNGFASEHSLRKRYQAFLGKNITEDLTKIKHGFGPHNFPNLIICGQYSLIKNNGAPFGANLQDDFWWPFYLSSSFNPTYFFLETIWTRLSYMFPQKISMDIFGEDLTQEQLNRFLDCRIKQLDGNIGWEYKYTQLTQKQLTENIGKEDWQPVELDEIQHAIITELCNKEEIDIEKDESLETFVKMTYDSLEDFVKTLEKTGLVYLEDNKLRLLTDLCQCVITPDGKYWAAENKSGRLTNWVSKKMEEWESKL